MLDVAIIGAGVAGIYTLKHCLECGLTAMAFDKNSHIGGVWDASNGPGCVSNVTYSVTSRLSGTGLQPRSDGVPFTF